MTISILADTNLELCLDFANTMDWHASDHPEETLLTYVDWVAWARDAAVVTEDEAEKLMLAAREGPRQADHALARARRLREAVYRIFTAVTRDDPPADKDLAILNKTLARAMRGVRIKQTPDGFVLGWEGVTSSLDALLRPIARSAGALLTSELRTHVGQCADDRGCGYLFLDTSKNLSRRWCSMESCGNRAKAARYYQRQKSS